MERISKRIRRRLNYATVVSAITAFVVLCGGAAFAANQLAKNSVGKKQLKANAVTTAKIKKNAVTAAKIKAGAIDGTKVKDGSLTSSSLNLADMPFSRIIHKARGSSKVALGPTATVFPLDSPAYTQAAGEDDFFSGTLDVTFESSCETEREAIATLAVDSSTPADPLQQDIVGVGFLEDEGSGTVTKRLDFGYSQIGGSRFRVDTATNHTLTLAVELKCKTGSGGSATNAAVDVVGVK